MEEIYLVGQEWYSSGEGSYPNNYEFPSLVTTDKNAARKKFDELKRENMTGQINQVAYWCTSDLVRKYAWEE